MIEIFSLENTVFTLGGYSMSLLELLGTMFNLWCVWLVTKRNVWNWPVGLVGVILFMMLFWQIRLYADAVEQVYYLITGVWGWILWSRIRKDEIGKVLVRTLSNTQRFGWMLLIVFGSLVLGWGLSYVHIWFPLVFSEPAALPFLDAFTTVMSFSAQYLLLSRRVESWMVWITVDVLAIGIYAVKGVFLVSILYGIFLLLASKGLWEWIRAYKQQRV
jgi:nicotinamide mononucleotide transporter